MLASKTVPPFSCSELYGRRGPEGFQRKRTALWAVAEGEFPERSGGGRSESPLVAREGETLILHQRQHSRNHPQNKTPPEIRQDFRVMGQGSKTLAGVLGAAPPTGIPKGKALWKGCRGGAPAGVWGEAPQAGVQRAQPSGGGVGGEALNQGCRGRSPRLGRGAKPHLPAGRPCRRLTPRPVCAEWSGNG